jgi:hypothetical protein
MSKGMGGIAIMGIILAIITVGIGSAIGLAMIAKTETVFNGLGVGTNASNAFNGTVNIIYSSWPLLGLAVLAMIGATVIAAIMIFR